MIEKFDDQNGFCMGDCMDKINEVIDAVNTIQKERETEWFEIKEWIDILEAVRKSVNVHEKQIDELQMKLEPEKVNMDIESPVVKMWREKLDKIERENRAKIDRQIVETLIRPDENVQITYMTDGHTKEYYGRNGASIVTDHPLPAGYVITIRETETKGGDNE